MDILQEKFEWLETWPEDFQPSQEARVISLRPPVSRQLDKKGTAYRLLEDYYDEEADLRDFEHTYFEAQLAWYDAADCFLKKHLTWAKQTNIEFARSYYFRLKYLTDDFVLRARALNAFIQKTGVSEIQLTCFETADVERSIFDFSLEERRSYSPVLDAYQKAHPELRVKFKRMALPTAVKKRLRRFDFLPETLRFFIRQIAHGYRYQVSKKKGRRDCNVLFMDAGTWAVDLVVRRVVAAGGTIFFESPTGVFSRLDRFIETVLPDADEDQKDPDYQRLVEECGQATEALGDGQAWASFYSQICGFDTAPFFLPYWSHFVREVIPRTYLEIQRHSRFYQSRNVKVLFQRDCTNPQAVGALIAAQLSKVRRVCLQHGFNVKDYESLYRTELDLYDDSVVQDDDTMVHFKKINQTGISRRCRVVESSDYFHALQSQRSFKKKGTPEKVFYLCSKVTGGIRCLNSLVQPFAGYFEYLKKVCETMAKHKSYDFILKLPGDQPWDRESIVDFLEERRWANIKIERKPFTEYLVEADRVIVDFPSTGFYEALVSGKSVLGLCRRSWRLRPEARERFAAVLRYFSTAEEAAEHIACFLNESADAYRVIVPMKQDDKLFFENLLEDAWFQPAEEVLSHESN